MLPRQGLCQQHMSGGRESLASNMHHISVNSQTCMIWPMLTQGTRQRRDRPQHITEYPGLLHTKSKLGDILTGWAFIHQLNVKAVSGQDFHCYKDAPTPDYKCSQMNGPTSVSSFLGLFFCPISFLLVRLKTCKGKHYKAKTIRFLMSLLFKRNTDGWFWETSREKGIEYSHKKEPLRWDRVHILRRTYSPRTRRNYQLANIWSVQFGLRSHHFGEF